VEVELYSKRKRIPPRGQFDGLCIIFADRVRYSNIVTAIRTKYLFNGGDTDILLICLQLKTMQNDAKIADSLRLLVSSSKGATYVEAR
jgi:hypothetical protein